MVVVKSSQFLFSLTLYFRLGDTSSVFWNTASCKQEIIIITCAVVYQFLGKKKTKKLKLNNRVFCMQIFIKSKVTSVVT